MAHTKPTDPRAPTAEMVRAARAAAGIDERTAGRMVHRTASAWIDWETGARRMDIALWELFNLKAHGRLP
jgi:hypothetical protein